MEFEPIGHIRSPFKEKFGIPRQPGVTQHVTGQIVLPNNQTMKSAIKGIEACSHLWLLFVFHACPQGKWKPTVRPPRLGGNRHVGVFATRSPFRPNPIGMSVVRFDGVKEDEQALYLCISQHDLLDQTPILDIKPYVPYADALEDAHHEWANASWEVCPVTFSDEAAQTLAQRPHTRALLEEILQQDPRPAYKKGKPDDKLYGVHIEDLNVQFQFIDGACVVVCVTPQT